MLSATLFFRRISACAKPSEGLIHMPTQSFPSRIWILGANSFDNCLVFADGFVPRVASFEVR